MLAGPDSITWVRRSHGLLATKHALGPPSDGHEDASSCLKLGPEDQRCLRAPFDPELLPGAFWQFAVWRSRRRWRGAADQPRDRTDTKSGIPGHGKPHSRPPDTGTAYVDPATASADPAKHRANQCGGAADSAGVCACRRHDCATGIEADAAAERFGAVLRHHETTSICETGARYHFDRGTRKTGGRNDRGRRGSGSASSASAARALS
jgi:hypothetical protein